MFYEVKKQLEGASWHHAADYEMSGKMYRAEAVFSRNDGICFHPVGSRGYYLVVSEDQSRARLMPVQLISRAVAEAAYPEATLPPGFDFYWDKVFYLHFIEFDSPTVEQIVGYIKENPIY